MKTQGFISSTVLGMLTALLVMPTGLAPFANAAPDINQAQAVARVRNILNNNSGPCRISQTKRIAAIRVKSGWRVAATIKMSGTLENVVWVVTQSGNSAPQNQLSWEIENACR